jgi:DNA-directed RNA polymerase subunit M/transcription elongation factor TFIIS
MYYLTVTEDDPKSLTLYCRNCGDTEKNTTESICIHKTDTEISEVRDTINQYTKLDPTLPRIRKMKCQNEQCPTNEESGHPAEIILIRYDHINLKYIYLCSTCDYTWKCDITKK